jgi:hypothetical protein
MPQVLEVVPFGAVVAVVGDAEDGGFHVHGGGGVQQQYKSGVVVELQLLPVQVMNDELGGFSLKSLT